MGLFSRLRRTEAEPALGDSPLVQGNPDQVALVEAVTGPARTLRADATRRLKKNKLAVAGLIWIIIVILIAGYDACLIPLRLLPGHFCLFVLFIFQDHGLGFCLPFLEFDQGVKNWK